MVFKDALFEAQWLRTAGHSSANGAELGECLTAARLIRKCDGETWFNAWHGLASRIFDEAGKSRSGGHPVSALGAYLRASNYFRAAYTFIMGSPLDPRVRDAYRLQRDAFQAAIALMRLPAECIAIPYEDATLHGYLFKSAHDAAPRPTLIITGGYDSTAEELYFFSAAAAVARGYTCIVFDGPGQGSALIEHGVIFRPDWEAVIRPVVDFALSRREVDPARLALLGISFGGYLAPRAASAESRLAACIADPGEFSLLEEMKSRVPAFIARELPNGNRFILAVLDRMMRRRMRHPTRGWGLRRALWVHGVDNPLAYMRLTADYSLVNRVEQIRCPTLICRAENDDIGVSARALYDALTCEKAFVAFTASEGAGAHCEAGARAVFNASAFDWLDALLGV